MFIHIYTHTHINLFIYVVGYKVIFLGLPNCELSLILKNRGTGSRTGLVTEQQKTDVSISEKGEG